ncbi:MAG TPA: hypothetical protein VLG36_05690 [Candidatus Chromulinivoraceae bacterium]|nr:hypothetical protein [Candidatus Chromulinivoraceae bacterium]
MYRGGKQMKYALGHRGNIIYNILLTYYLDVYMIKILNGGIADHRLTKERDRQSSRRTYGVKTMTQSKSGSTRVSGRLVGRVGLIALDELFDAEVLEKMEREVRYQTIKVFALARSRTDSRATPGYVLGLGDKVGDLARYVAGHVKAYTWRAILTVKDLPVVYGACAKSEIDYILRRIKHELIVRVLVRLRDEFSIWYMSGEWSMVPTVVDDYLLSGRPHKDSYHNARNYHGRPKRDRRRLKQLGMAPGVSTAA